MELFGNTKILNDYTSVDNFVTTFTSTYRDCYKSTILTKNQMLYLLNFNERWDDYLEFETDEINHLYLACDYLPVKNLTYTAELVDSHYILTQLKKPINFHRALYLLFIGDINDPNLVVDHIDDNPVNNQLKNFRLITRKANYAKNCVNDICLKGFKNYNWTKEMLDEMLAKICAWAECDLDIICSKEKLENLKNSLKLN